MSGNPAPGAGHCGPEQHSGVGYGLENQVREEDNDSPDEDIDVQRGSEGWHESVCISAHELLRHKSFSGFKGTIWLCRHFLGHSSMHTVPIVPLTESPSDHQHH